jgi:DNA-binding phage protein
MTKKTLTLEQVRAALSDRNLKTVAERTGLAADTLYRIMHGHGEPTHATLVVLSIYLDGGCSDGQT